MYFKIILIALVAYALILIAYPETRLWLKELIKKHPFLSGSLTCLVFVIITFLYFPPLFKSIAIEFWGIPTTVYQDGSVEVAQLVDLGPIGDIFGSLNSFISSIALCAVAFSTWLQVTSLKETREANERQLQLAKETHDAQIKESQLSNFSTAFYALLNYKNLALTNLVFEDKSGEEIKIYKGTEIFKIFYKKFDELHKNEWKDFQQSQFTEQLVRAEFNKFVKELTGDYYADIYVYFHIYGDLLNLIKSAKISNSNKNLYHKILLNSMTLPEQVTLFWVAAYIVRIKDFVNKRPIFDQFYKRAYENFAFRFYDEKSFPTKTWKKVFKRKPPA